MIDIFAIDVGGTFTDLIALNSQTGNVQMVKVPTTPRAPTEGVLAAGAKADLVLRETTTFFHGTTLGINTILEKKGALTGLITTKGFRDVLEIGRSNWPMYRLHWERPQPLVPRYLRKEVQERVRVDGTVIRTLDDAEVRKVIDELLSHGVESIAVCFLHAYAFPAHEERVGALLAKEYPEVSYTLSHHITREYREYERTLTTVIDALIKPRLSSYIDALDTGMRDADFEGELFITRCDGGVMTAAEARGRSVLTLISGPASGVMGSATLSRELNEDRLIAADMGGTSFDAALVIDHEPVLSPMTHVDGLPLLVPVVELATIGAGGGSIAWVDPAGGLKVGPQSAGADPGPICYGKGGTEPTFTDAALVSGLLDPEYFLGGEIDLDGEAASDAIDRLIAQPLGLDARSAAAGIVALTEVKMAATIEEITIGKGYDPREFTLLAYGGGGPLVGAALAQRLEIPTVIIPRSAAAFSAWGMLTLDIVHDRSRTDVQKLELIDRSHVRTIFDALASEGEEALARDKVPVERRSFLYAIDMRYEGQDHTLSVRLDRQSVEALHLDDLRVRFDEAHSAAYAYSLSDPVEIVAYRVRAIGGRDRPPRPVASEASGELDGALRGVRRAVHVESGGALEWTIYEREALPQDVELHGPAIVEEPTSTTILPPTWSLTVDFLGNLVLRRTVDA